jgi:hypothetical protein
MASKPEPVKTPTPKKPSGASSPNEDQDAFSARTVLRPTFQAAAAIAEYEKIYQEIGLLALLNALGEQVSAVGKGNLKRAEAMLTAQAHTLDALFGNLARRAANTERVDNFERYLKLALRAQSQCRATWEALAAIKNPPVMGYVRQANIAHGPQQVNNGPAAAKDVPRARENSNVKNKLLEKKDGERLDPGTACAPGRVDPEMATVGEIDRAEDRDR